MNRRRLLTALPAALLAVACCAQAGGVTWKHLSSKNGDLPAPNAGTEQTSAAVFDIDRDGVNDFVITERTAAPAVLWYRRGPAGWTRYVLEDAPLRLEAGSCAYDVDGGGDLDVVAGGDAGSNQIWWWENPYPKFKPSVPWKRHLIKTSGVTKHHDQIFGDFDGDGAEEFVFWNQNARALFLAEIPPDPRYSGPWPFTEIYAYSADSQPEQRGKPAGFKGVNEHEGLAQADIDGDGNLDIFCAEMRLNGGNPDAKIYLLLGDGNGTFRTTVVDTGFDNHESKIADLDGNGTPDVLGKPYNWDTPRLEIWLNPAPPRKGGIR